MIIDEEVVHTIIAGIILQAYKDWCVGYTRPGIPDAGVFLERCGLLSPEGDVDRRLCAKAVKRTYERRRRKEVTR